MVCARAFISIGLRLSKLNTRIRSGRNGVVCSPSAARLATIINIQKNQLKLNSESIMELNIYV